MLKKTPWKKEREIEMVKRGIAEWADKSMAIQLGCEHGCKYCWACYNAVHRYHWCKDRDEWMHPMLRQHQIRRHASKLKAQRIMFPSTHDITPWNIDVVVPYIFKWLAEGNQMLIVSKPHADCVKRMCEEFMGFENQIVFRFTIGSADNRVLGFWDPGAPLFEERLQCCRIAFHEGYQVSVNTEPMLDKNVYRVIDRVIPFANHSIWVGLMNDRENRVDLTDWKMEDMHYLKTVSDVCSRDFVHKLVHELTPMARYHNLKWKDSIKKIMGYPEEAIG